MRKVTFASVCAVVIAALAGCGPNLVRIDAAVVTAASGPTPGVSALPCLVRPTTLPDAAQMPTTMIRAYPLGFGFSIEYLGNTNPDPEYKGFGELVYAWTGLLHGPAAQFDTPNPSKTSGNQSGDTNVVDNLPSSGPLFTLYPTQIFTVSVEADDFGSVPAAQRWMAESRTSYPVNDIPVRGNIVRYPDLAHLGDDTFAMQMDRTYAGGPGSAAQLGPFVGDVFTNIEIRHGMYVYSVGVDAAPHAAALEAATRLIGDVISDQVAACSTTASGDGVS